MFFLSNLEVDLDLLPLQIFKETITYSIHVDCSLFVYFLLNECEKILFLLKLFTQLALSSNPPTSYGQCTQAGLPQDLNPSIFRSYKEAYVAYSGLFGHTIRQFRVRVRLRPLAGLVSRRSS